MGVPIRFGPEFIQSILTGGVAKLVLEERVGDVERLVVWQALDHDPGQREDLWDTIVKRCRRRSVVVFAASRSKNDNFVVPGDRWVCLAAAVYAFLSLTLWRIGEAIGHVGHLAGEDLLDLNESATRGDVMRCSRKYFPRARRDEVPCQHGRVDVPWAQ